MSSSSMPDSPMASTLSQRGFIDTSSSSYDKLVISQKFKDINWDDITLTSLGSLSSSSSDKLKSLDEKPLQYTLDDENETKIIIQILLSIVKDINNPLYLQFAVYYMNEILELDQVKYAPYFLQNTEDLDIMPFLKIIQHEDPYVVRTGALVLAQLLITFESSIIAIDNYLSHVCGVLSDSGFESGSSTVKLILPSLCILLREKQCRLVFGSHGGVGLLTKVLRLQGSIGDPQYLYEVAFCLWTLTFEEQLKSDFTRSETVSVLAEQVVAASREKVVRVSLAALRNLCYGRLDALNEQMITCGLPKTIENLLERQISDSELIEDAEFLSDALQKDARDLSTWERYVSEVASGQLKQGILHTEKFWRENVRKTENKEFKIIKDLVALLMSEDEEVVCLACYDLGEFARFYPNGKNVVKMLGARDIVMNLIMNQGSTKIEKFALQCISKMMIQKWEFIKN